MKRINRVPHVEFFLMIAAGAGLMILACHRPLKGAPGAVGEGKAAP